MNQMPFPCLAQNRQSVVCQMSLVLTPIPEGNEFPPFIIKFQSGHSTSVEIWERKSLGMWYHISLTHKKWLLVCHARNEIWNHLYQQKTGVDVCFCRWMESDHKPRTMESLPRDLPLCWAWSESTFSSGNPWNCVCLVCTLVIYCFTFFFFFFRDLPSVCGSLPKFSNYLCIGSFPPPL